MYEPSSKKIVLQYIDLLNYKVYLLHIILEGIRKLFLNEVEHQPLYIREDLIKNSMADEIKPFVTKLNLQSFDFHHEREWRVPCDFEFNYNQIAIVYAPTRYHNQIRQEFPQIKNIYDLDLLQLI